jgi:quercetin dioxygenase-like cupin family protein
MSAIEPAAKGRAVVVQPEDGKSFWQPVPASGHADPKLTPDLTGFKGLSMGYQTVAPGGRVRLHSHDAQVELQICFRGAGTVMVDGAAHPLRPGTACFLGYDTKHEIINDGAEELIMLWVIAPSGLEDFFAAIGRPRAAGEPAPEPFARPEDVVATERAMGMQDTKRE